MPDAGARGVATVCCGDHATATSCAMTDGNELIATCWTIAGDVCPGTANHLSPFPLEDRIAAAAAAGYTGIGLWHGDLLGWRQRADYPTLRRLLEAAGIRHIELEYLADWFAAGEARLASDRMRRDLFAAADALGARHIKVMPPFGGQGLAERSLVDAFGELCDEARRHGLLVALEMIPYSDLTTLADTLAIVRGAGAANGGLLVDIWHLLRSGSDLDAVLALPPGTIVAAEINDAGAAVIDDLATDSLRHRKLCGEGDFDIPRFIRHLREAGFTGPIGVEILSDALRRQPLATAADTSFATAIRQFA